MMIPKIFRNFLVDSRVPVRTPDGGQRPRLKNVEINPGRLCNNKCIFCMSGEERDDHEPWADVRRMKSEISRRYEEGARSLGFLGGEPSAYPHILDCISHARELGYQRIALCTNGTRLAHRDFMESALTAGLTRVTISLHSHLPDIEEYLVGVPGILDKKLEAIRNLVDARGQGRLPDGLSLNPVLCRQNAPHMQEYVLFFKTMGISDIRFNFIWPESRVSQDKSVIPQYGDVMPGILALILRNERDNLMRLSFGGVPYCVLPRPVQDRWELIIKYFYEEGLDLPTDVSFLRQDDRGTIDRFNWHKKGHDEYRGKVGACASCRFDPVCMGIYRSYLSLYGEGEFQAP